jgi:hypothetical protein
MSDGICALCRQHEELKQSHIVPNSVFRRIKRGNHGKLIKLSDATDGPVHHSIDSWCEYLLCKKCEHTIGRYEKAALEALRGERKGSAHIHEAGITFRAFDYATLKLFFTSLLWRAHVSTLVEYSKVGLLPHTADDARKSLLAGRALRSVDLGCRLSLLFDPTPNGFSQDSIKQLIVSPFSRVKSSFVSFVFVFEGYVIEFYVPRARRRHSDKHGFLRRTTVWYVPKVNIFDIPELVELLVSGYEKAARGDVKLSS